MLDKEDEETAAIADYITKHVVTKLEPSRRRLHDHDVKRTQCWEENFRPKRHVRTYRLFS
jgi:hypothetical protein